MVTVKLKADVLRAAAAKRNLSLAGLAEMIGVNPTYLPVILSGRHRMSPRLRRRILKRLGLKFDDLFSLVETS